MDMPTIEALKRARIKWLDVSFSYKDKNHFIEIRTPFPDMFHDNISLVSYKDADGNLMLSDDGYTMDELGTLGFDTNTSVKRKKYFNDTLLSFGVQYAPTGELTIKIPSLSKYAQAELQLIQCITQVGDMLATSRDRTKDLFLEDVVNFLINSDISVNTNVKDTGQSGNNINFEILIGRTKTTSAKALKLVNNPTGNAYKEPIFSITYVRSFNDEIKFYLFANDLERNISPSFQSAAEGYNIMLLPWSQKASWIGQLRLA